MQSHVKISFWSAVLMSINIIVGAGVFFNPKAMTALAGSYSFLGWILVSLVLFPVIWSLSQAAALFPGEGGFYNYCSNAIGTGVGFFAQWAYLIGYIGTASTYCTVIRELAGFSFTLEHPHLTNFILVFFFSILNLAQMGLIAKIQSAGALIKMIPLGVVIALGGFYYGPHVSFSSHNFNNLLSIVSIPLFSFLGFEVCCSIGHMIEGGSKQASKAILTAFFVTACLYSLFHLGVLYIMGTENLATHGAIAFPMYLGLPGNLTPIAQSIITFFILFSVINGLYGVFSMNIENLYMLAKKNLLIGSSLLIRKNSNDRPVVSIIVHGIIVLSIITMIQSSEVLMVLTCMGVCSAYFLSVLALFVTFLKYKNYFYALFASLGFMSCSVLMYFGWLQMSQNDVSKIILLAALAAGPLLYLTQKCLVKTA